MPRKRLRGEEVAEDSLCPRVVARRSLKEARRNSLLEGVARCLPNKKESQNSCSTLDESRNIEGAMAIRGYFEVFEIGDVRMLIAGRNL